MKESRMNMDNLSKPELLMLFSVLEGELEARDLVIEALRAQHRDAFVQERYGKYNLSDPFLALQRDNEVGRGLAQPERGPLCSSPLTILKLVMSHCKRMQERMLAQLAAAESRHRKVIADLEEEKRRHAQDTAEGDDVTYMLEKERERLLQQLDFEKAQVKRLEKEQKKLSGQAEEDRAQHKQLSSALAKECKRATARAAEESQRVAELGQQLEEERGVTRGLQAELEAERKRALQMEARAEKQLDEFDTEREQLRARLKKEEGRSKELQEEVERLRKELAELRGREGLPLVPTMASVACQNEASAKPAAKSSTQPKMNGHYLKDGDPSPGEKTSQENGVENGGLHSPVHLHQSLSPTSTASSSLTSSPCSSPVLAKRLMGLSATSPGYQSSYQAGINQRFQAARHKFQAQAEQEQQVGGVSPRSPRDLSPTAAEHSSAKQLARNTVTQVLSRFTNQQSKPGSPSNSSPFGTDYRTLAPPPHSRGDHSPTAGKVSSPLSPGIKSPTIPRAERGHPPPIPPKKPGLAQSPASPVPPGRASQFPELSGSCGLTSSPEAAKEPDLVMSTTS
ncbi:CTTNBP2 N-terminal-like protein isoform X1 [Lepisosteus oculatus]|uniref:CTTNBP2 N-terminal-like protein isoform X1 n=1 Tax=Lepisosteus oculatus TaxID=7918 RepID=UPI0037190902